MKIYFVGSISGKAKFLSNYKKIIDTLKKFNHEVSENTLGPTFEYVYSSMTEESKVKQYQDVLRWINSCDTMVAEVSNPSLGVGFEISLALERGKSVIVLYCEGNAPHFLEGANTEKLIISRYTNREIEEILKEAIKFTSVSNDSRFNFFLSKSHMKFLDEESRKAKVPKSVFLRDLIENDMKNNSKYLK